MKALLPAAIGWPSALPRMPRPGTARTSVVTTGSSPRAAAATVTARASPCSEWRSSPAPRASTSSVPAPSHSMPTMRDLPEVSVPVLSKASNRVRARASRVAGSRTRQPQRANRPMPSEVASGAARPTAHGQATTSTASPTSSARSNGNQLRPISDRQPAEDENDRHRDADHAIGNALHRAAAGQRVAHRPANLRPAGGGAGAAALDQQRSVDIDAAGDHRGAGAFGDLAALPGDHGFIGVGQALDNDTVDRNALARPDAHQHAGADLTHRAAGL